MAYLIDQTTVNVDSATSHLSASMPDHQQGDLLVLSFCSDPDSNTDLPTISTGGWTALDPSPTPDNGRRLWTYYKIVTGSLEPGTVFNLPPAYTERIVYQGLSFRDVDQTTPLLTSSFNFTNSNVGRFTMPSVTATEPDALAVAIKGGGNFEKTLMPDTQGPDYLCTVPVVNNVSGIISGIYQISQTGSIPTIDFTQPDDEQVGSLLLLKNSEGGKTLPIVSASIERLNLYGLFAQASPEETEVTFSDFYTFYTGSINGKPVDSGSFLSVSNFNNFVHTEYDGDLIEISQLNRSFSANTWSGAGYTLASPLDLTGNLLSVTLAISFPGSTGPDGFGVWLSDGTNWAVYNIPESEIGGASAPSTIYIGTSSTPLDSFGTLNFSNITQIAYIEHVINSSERDLRYSLLYKVGKQVFTGGTSAKPITIADMEPYYTHYPLLDTGGKQGRGQVFLKSALQIGDGSSETHFDASSNSLEFPATEGRWNVGPNDVGVFVNASANDTILFEATILATATVQPFEILPGSSTSATYSFSGASIIGFQPKFKTGVNVNNATFIECETILGRGSEFTNTSFRSSISTGSALQVDGPTTVSNCAFTKGSETYAIEFTQTGSYVMENTTFSGYTTELNITPTTGSLDIQLATGQATSSFNTAGATVNFIQPQSTGEITNIVSGSRLQIYNETTDLEIINQLVGTSYSVSYTEGNNYNNGDTLRIRLTYVSGSTAYDWYEARSLVGSTGWSLLADQQVESNYAVIGIDGSTVTEFTLDTPNIQVDLDDADGLSTKQRFVAWFYYAGTLEDGIRTFFKGVELEDASNAVINVPLVDLKLDNVSTRQIQFTDNDFRLYRSDNTDFVAYPSSGGYGITSTSGKVYVIETGVSGLTTEESNQLSNINTTLSSPVTASLVASQSALLENIYTEVQQITGSGGGSDTALLNEITSSIEENRILLTNLTSSVLENSSSLSTIYLDTQTISSNVLTNSSSLSAIYLDTQTISSSINTTNNSINENIQLTLGITSSIEENRTLLTNLTSSVSENSSSLSAIYLDTQTISSSIERVETNLDENTQLTLQITGSIEDNRTLLTNITSSVLENSSSLSTIYLDTQIISSSIETISLEVSNNTQTLINTTGSITETLDLTRLITSSLDQNTQLILGITSSFDGIESDLQANTLILGANSDQLNILTGSLSTVQLTVDSITGSILEVHQLHGLDPSEPLTVTQTSRTFGDVVQSISTTGEGASQQTIITRT